MAEKTALRTEFVRVGTAGKTVDGRDISDQDLYDIAETYDPEEYAAVINYEHIRYFGNLGLVHEVKVEKNSKGEVQLHAVLEPNKYMLQMNADGQKLFTSMEVARNYRGTGKAYLVGLALTDSPASAGTTRINFSHRVDKDHLVSNPQSFEFSLDESEHEQAPGWFTKFIASIKPASTGGESDPEEDEPMNEKQFQQLHGAISAMATNFNALADKLQPAAPSGDGEDEPAGDIPNPAGESFSAEEGKALKEQMDSISTQLTELNDKFTQALNTPAGKDTPDAQGDEGQDKVL